jgi:hypothetical protein
LLESRKVGLGIEGFAGGALGQVAGEIPPAMDVNFLPEPMQQGTVISSVE